MTALPALVALLVSAQSPEAFAEFEKHVRPLLRATCAPCHSAANRTSGLALDSRQDAFAGGNRGVVIKPGDAAGSLLVAALEQKGDLKMPPGARLPEAQIAAIRVWIDRGAAWPADPAAPKRRGWDHWAFQAPKRQDPPRVADTTWVKNEIDRFVLARLEREGVRPSPEADRYTLLRRVSLDLTGLPPSPSEIEAFVNDRSPGAYEKVVDRLLASPHHAERWARHWLDVARYSDSDGYTIDDPRPMWKYRDWVIASLHRDQPFDQFVVEQIAGDMIPGAAVEQIVATAFHRNTASNYEGGIDFEQYRNEAVADRVAVTGGAFLGLTLGCARCHDHKYDPLTQREFYQIFAYFNNTDEITTEAERYDFNRPILKVPTPQEELDHRAWKSEFSAVNRELALKVRELAAKPAAADDPPKHRDPELTRLLAKYRGARRREPPMTSVLVMRELPEPRPAYIHLGGEFTRPGASVSPATPAVLAPALRGGTRLDFAKWLVDPRNPLTARVTVNRMWQAYFGKGLVETESDFGLMGARPTHPELLDWLATEFIARGWSQKAMHRLIVTSAAYRQSSRQRPELDERDPYNNLLARQSRLRVEAEIARDCGLAASGLLNPAIGGPSVYPPIPMGALAVTQVRKLWPTSFGPNRYRRGLYTFSYRSNLHPGLGMFDAPDGTQSCTRRVRSNSPLQALTLLNDTAFVEFARALGERLAGDAAADRARIERGFLLAVGRKPRDDEYDRIMRFVALQRDLYRSDPAAARALLGGDGDIRAIQEAEEGAKGRPGGPQSAGGRIAGERALAEAQAELKVGRAKAAERAALVAALDPVTLGERAAWTAVARVLLNLDDFVTRN
jgi:hypothetical protein